ncbi:MAG: hypothetical protein WAT66_13345 [Actinomycetota bacterium]
MPERDVLDVDENLVTALLPPKLITRVARVPQDRPDAGLGPCARAELAFTTTRGVVHGWRRHAIPREVFGDRPESLSTDILLEDASNDRRLRGIGLELMQSLTGGCLSRVRVRPCVAESVAIWHTPPEVPTLRGLRAHRCSSADLDSVPLALRHAAEERHDHVVGVRARVDAATDLRDPQLDIMVREKREGHREL